MTGASNSNLRSSGASSKPSSSTTKRLAIGLLSLFLLPFVTSCAPRIQTVYMPMPQALTAETPYPEPRLRDVENNGELLLHSKTAEAAITSCNSDKAKIRAVGVGSSRR